jgi:hypothetical protein
VEVIAACPKTAAVAGLCDDHMDERVRGRGRPVGEVAQLRARLETAEQDNARLRRELSRIVGAPIVLPEETGKDASEWRKVAMAAQALVIDYEVMMRRGERPGLRALVDAGLHTFLNRQTNASDLALVDQGWRIVREEAARLVCMSILEVAAGR